MSLIDKCYSALSLSRAYVNGNSMHSKAEMVGKLDEVLQEIARASNFIADPPPKPSPALQSLCVFLPTGKTFTFRSVVITCDNETMLVFEYSAASDGKKKHATFPKANICGHAVTP